MMNGVVKVVVFAQFYFLLLSRRSLRITTRWRRLPQRPNAYRCIGVRRRLCAAFYRLHASAVRHMLATCDEFASQFQVSFLGQKSNCLIVQPKNRNCRLDESGPAFQIGKY
jgi:hypothetical protein